MLIPAFGSPLIAAEDILGQISHVAAAVVVMALQLLALQRPLALIKTGKIFLGTSSHMLIPACCEGFPAGLLASAWKKGQLSTWRIAACSCPASRACPAYSSSKLKQTFAVGCVLNSAHALQELHSECSSHNRPTYMCCSSPVAAQ